MANSVGDPKLLVFYLGSFLEQQQALNNNLYSAPELLEIWTIISKMPLGIDQSKVKGFQIHSSLLKQPALSSEIVLELLTIYQNSQTSLISEVIKHQNCPILEVINIFKQGERSENWTQVLWSLNSENMALKVQLVELLTADGAKVERLKYHLHHNFATNPMKDILSICLQFSTNKSFIQEMYFYLNKNHQCSVQNIADVLLNRNHTGLKVLKNVWSQVKRLSSNHKASLLTHPNVDEKLLVEMLKTLMLDLTRDVALFNATLWLLQNRNIPETILQNLYLQALPHLELLNLVVKHPTFNHNWAWNTLKDPQYALLPPLNLALLKTALKNI